MQALKLGFSSIMFDGSAKDYEMNISQIREIVNIAHSFVATVEGEIEHVGNAESSDNDNKDMYTTVEEAKLYIRNTGVDALAIAIGTARGTYKSKPKLDFDRLREIRCAIDEPLVLHGGSGLTDDDFKKVILNGISKVNICTDLCIVAENAVKESVKAELFRDANT